jgi:hypothetical protein
MTIVPRMVLLARLAVARWTEGAPRVGTARSTQTWRAITLLWRRVRSSRMGPTLSPRAAICVTTAANSRRLQVVTRWTEVSRVLRIETRGLARPAMARRVAPESRVELPRHMPPIAYQVAQAETRRMPATLQYLATTPMALHARPRQALGRIRVREAKRVMLERPPILVLPAKASSRRETEPAAVRKPLLQVERMKHRAIQTLGRAANRQESRRPLAIPIGPDRPLSKPSTPDLVWRKVSAASVSAPRDQIERESTPDGAGAAVLHRSAALRESAKAPLATPTAAHTIVAAPSAYDAAFVDRLAEDVMRRVERRVRIERERRGM